MVEVSNTRPNTSRNQNSRRNQAPVVTRQAAPAAESEVTTAADAAVTSAAVEDVKVVTEPTEQATVTATTILVGDDEQVKELKTKLQAFAEVVVKPGELPEHHRNAARLSSQIAKFIIQNPKVEVLDAYLLFIRENLKGLSEAQVYLKGTSTLSPMEEREVGYLHNLFMDLARRQIVAINSSMVIQVLKKPEIVSYFNRLVTGFKQGAL